MKNRFKPFAIILILLLMVFTSLEIKVVVYNNNYSPIKSDAALILGHSLVDGLTPDTFLIQRLEKGLEIYKNNLCDYIILSGGQGPTDTLPVANAMKTWLVEKGVPSKKIITESYSKNTYENMSFSKKLAEEKNIESIIIVTSDFHIFRSILIAKQFFTIVSGAASQSEPSLHTVLMYIKEPFSIIKYYIERNL